MFHTRNLHCETLKEKTEFKRLNKFTFDSRSQRIFTTSFDSICEKFFPRTVCDQTLQSSESF